MNTATRIDFARAQAGGADARFFALALASGIAGLTVTYPTITLGNGTVGEWAGRFEVRPPRLATTGILPETSITAKFHDAAVVAAHSASATTAGLANAFALAAGRMSEADSSPNVRQTSLSARPMERSAASGHFVSTPAPTASIHGHAATGKILNTGSTSPVAEGVHPAVPLDAIRIVLPPAAGELDTSGAMPPQATLASIATAQPATLPDEHSLVSNSRPQASPASLSATTGGQPLALLSAPKEVQEFDLAKLGSAKSLSDDLARSAADVIAAVKPAGRVGDLSKVPKVPDRVVGDHILHVAGLSLEGMPSGHLSVRVGMSGDLSVKLAELLVPVQDQMAPDAFQRLANSSAASEYVSFAQLRAAGFDIRYDAGSDRLMVSVQP